MNHVIEFESDHFIKNGHCTIIEVEIEVLATGSDPTDISLWYQIESMYNVDLSRKMDLKELPEDDIEKLKKACEKAVEELAAQAWAESRAHESDYYYDCYKEGGYDEPQ